MWRIFKQNVWKAASRAEWCRAGLIIATQVGPGQDTTEKLSRIDRNIVCLTCCKIVTVVFCVFFRRKSVLWVNYLMPLLKSVSFIVLNDFCNLIIFIQNILAWAFIFIFNETAYFKDNICFSQKFPQNKSHMVQRVWRNIQKKKKKHRNSYHRLVYSHECVSRSISLLKHQTFCDLELCVRL